MPMMLLLQKLSKEDQAVLRLLGTVFVVLVFISYSKWGNEIIDCFRNPYMADEILDGKLLYKDVYTFYGPLIVYFNALLFFIFSPNMHVLYITGIILACIITILCYYIARQFFQPYIAGALIFLFLVQSVFRPGLYQYIFPYSYEALYGILFILIILICLIRLIKYDLNNQKLYYIASFLTALLALIKQDSAIIAYIMFYGFVIFYTSIKKIDLKHIWVSLVIPLLLPLLAYLLMLGFISFQDLIEGISPVRRLRIGSVMSLVEPIYLIKAVVVDLSPIFLEFILSITLFLGVFYGLLTLSYKWKNNYLLAASFSIVLLVGLILLFQNNFFSIYPFKFIISWYMYAWIALFLVIYLIIYCVLLVKKRQFPDISGQLFVLVVFTGFICLFRTIFTVSLDFYSNMYIFPGVLALFYFIYTKIPEKIQNINREIYEKAFIFMFIFMGMVCILMNSTYYMNRNIAIKTHRGSYYLNILRGQQIKEAISYILKHTNKNDKIYAPPEEMILNVMTGRQGATRYYQSLPSVLRTQMDQLRVIDDLKKNKPVLILISNNKNIEYYGGEKWGQDFANLIMEWILDNYSYTKTITAKDPSTKEQLDYKIDIYSIKHKKQQMSSF
jgi:hypothetical protein